MTSPLPPERIIGGTVTETEHPAGLLRFEEFAVGEWLTVKGEPARKARRGYFLNGEQLPFSVSDITGTLEKPALYSWFEDRGCRGGVKAERLGELEGVPEEEWVKRVRFLDIGADAMRDEAADRGKAVHDVFHTVARTGEAPDISLVHPGARLWYRGALRAWLHLAPMVIDAEFLICHPQSRYAGRPDLLALVDDKVTLIDWKSSLRGTIYQEAHFQTRGYAEALPPSGYPAPERIVIVAIDDSGGFLIEECAVEPYEWWALVQVAQARRDIERRRTAHRKALSEALKEAA